MSGDQFDIVQGNRETITGTLHDPAATPGDVLTVQADKSIAAQPGGGGSGGVQVVTVPVSSAEILALHDTDKVLVAGVPGFTTVVQNVAGVYVAGATPYAGVATLPVATRSLSDPTGTVATWIDLPVSGFLDQTESQEKVVGYGAGIVDGPVSDWSGRDVILYADSENPTAGDGTLLVTVSYFLAPTV